MQNRSRELIGMVTARAGEESGIFRLPSYMRFDLVALTIVLIVTF